MPKPVCVKCQRFYRPKKNGTYWVEGKPKFDRLPPAGTGAPDEWTGYKLWLGDLWECQGCGNEIIVGSGANPVAMHHEPGFIAAVTASGPRVQINDC